MAAGSFRGGFFPSKKIRKIPPILPKKGPFSRTAKWQAKRKKGTKLAGGGFFQRRLGGRRRPVAGIGRGRQPTFTFLLQVRDGLCQRGCGGPFGGGKGGS